MKERHRRAKKLFSAVLLLSWLSFMATAGFFLPSFLTRLPAFQIKEVRITGNEKIPFESIKKTLKDLSDNFLKLNEEDLKGSLNAQFEGRVKKVFLSKDIDLDGIILTVRVVERKPLAKVRIGKEILLIDEEGFLFYPLGDDLSRLAEIRAYNLQILKDNFTKLRESVLSVRLPIRLIEISEDKVTLHLKNKLVILPPIEDLTESVSSRLKLIYNFPEEKVDLRYGRFILVEN